MAPGKKDLKEENVLMSSLVPLEKRTNESKLKIVCVVKDETNADGNCREIVQNLCGDTSMMKFYEFIAETVGYVVQSFSLVFLKPTSDGKSFEEVILENESCTTLAEVVGKSKGKRSNFLIKRKNGKSPVNRIQHPTDSGESSEGNTYAGVSNLFKTETSFTIPTVAKSESGFVGLINQAMTCYLNSLLQTLFMTPEFRNALYRWKFAGTAAEASKSIPYQLQRLFLKLQTSKKRAVETTDLTKSFGWDSSEAWQQHDVQELCRVMFDALEETLKDTDQANMINQLYQGKMKDYVKCLKCSHESARTDMFLDIPLSIRPFGSNESFGKIEDALRAFIAPEILDGNNQYFCEKCNLKQDAHKGLKFVTFPYLLTIQLKRFTFDYKTGQRIKLHDRVVFPEKIWLDQFLHEEEDIKTKPVHTSSCKTHPLEEKVANGIDVDSDNCINGKEMATELKSNSATDNHINNSSEFYELFSIMIHSGNALGGHYYAYIKSFEDGKWYCFNDQHVYEISKSEIEKSYGGLDASARGFYSATYSSSTNAYMLMYRKKDGNVTFDDPTSWPDHIKSLRRGLEREEDNENDRKAKERDVCKVRLFCKHPTTGEWMEKKLHVEQWKTLKDATEEAWKLLELEKCIKLENCRLVKYDDYYGSFERSYEGEEGTEVGILLGGVKQSYSFDLLLETKSDEQEFPVYELRGTTIKIHKVDLRKSEVCEPLVLHAKAEYTVSDLKNALEKEYKFPINLMRIAVGKDSNDFRLLIDSKKTLKAEGFYKSTKIYVETSGGPDSKIPFEDSEFAKVLEKYANTISLIVELPYSDEITKQAKEIIIKIDKRNTLANLKEQLAKHVGVHPDNFRVYRLYSNNQEYETTRLSEQLTAYSDESKIIIRLGRALKSGETRIKVYLLEPNKQEHTRFIMETVVSEGVKIMHLKKEVMKELKNSFDIEAASNCIRLRKKSWKSPSTIYNDDCEFEKDIKLTVNSEFFVEVIDEKLQKSSSDIISIYTRRWLPSKYIFEPIQEIQLEEHSIKSLKTKLSEISGLPENDIEIAKGKGYFPYQSSVFDIQQELDWDPDISKLSEYPIAIMDDGCVIYYKDKNEELGELTEEKKKEIKEKERKSLQQSSTATSYTRKEKALKIYTNRN